MCYNILGILEYPLLVILISHPTTTISSTNQKIVYYLHQEWQISVSTWLSVLNLCFL